MIVVEVGILVFKGAHCRSSVVRFFLNCAIRIIVSLSAVLLAIFYVDLTHFEITTAVDDDAVARGPLTIVIVSDNNDFIQEDVSALD